MKFCSKKFPKKFLPKKILPKKNLANRKFITIFFCRKSYIVLKYNLHITLEVEIWHLGSTHKIYVKTGSFGWFSLVHFWFGLVGFVFLTLTAVLGGNSTWGSNYQMFWDEITFSSLTLLRSSSRLTVSAWVSPSSTPACYYYLCAQLSHELLARLETIQANKPSFRLKHFT